jgi:hypothetical protein
MRLQRLLQKVPSHEWWRMRPNFEPQKEHRLVMAHLLYVRWICEKSAGRHRRASTLLVGLAEGVRAKCGHSARNPEVSDSFPIARGLLQREALLFVKIGTTWMAAPFLSPLGRYLQSKIQTDDATANSPTQRCGAFLDRLDVPICRRMIRVWVS